MTTAALIFAGLIFALALVSLAVMGMLSVRAWLRTRNERPRPDPDYWWNGGEKPNFHEWKTPDDPIDSRPTEN